jgi:hypothetical protein
VALMEGKKTPAQTRAYAAVALLDRGHGRPSQVVTGEGGTGPVSFTLIEELHRHDGENSGMS